jgi:hypothetical protein
MCKSNNIHPSSPVFHFVLFILPSNQFQLCNNSQKLVVTYSLSMALNTLILDITLSPAITEMSHVLQRAGIAGFLGLGAGPLLLSRPTPSWRIALLGSSALASCSLPFLVLERLTFHSILNATNAFKGERTRYALYISHTMGAVLGAGIMHTIRRSRGRVVVPMQVLVAMLGKAQIEWALMKDR